jgi:hypothetical protein
MTSEASREADVVERLQQLVRRAQGGDQSVLGELRAALDANPDLWQRYGDLALQAQASWLNLVAGADLFLRETLERKLEQVRNELGIEGASPLERLLVDRVVACWLQTHYADTTYAQLKEPTPAQHTAALRRQSACQQRYLQAIKALVTVRKLLRPPLSPVDLALRPSADTRATRATAGRLRPEREPLAVVN